MPTAQLFPWLIIWFLLLLFPAQLILTPNSFITALMVVVVVETSLKLKYEDLNYEQLLQEAWKFRFRAHPPSSWTSMATEIFLAFWRKKYSIIQLQQERPSSNILAVMNSEFAQALRNRHITCHLHQQTLLMLWSAPNRGTPLWHYDTLYNTMNALYLAIAHIFRPQNQELLMPALSYLSSWRARGGSWNLFTKEPGVRAGALDCPRRGIIKCKMLHFMPPTLQIQKCTFLLCSLPLF